jgi:hypothetical protein
VIRSGVTGNANELTYSPIMQGGFWPVPRSAVPGRGQSHVKEFSGLWASADLGECRREQFTLVPNRLSACFVSRIDRSMSPISEAKPGKRECNTAKHGHWNERPSSVPGVEDAGQQG